MCQHKILSEKGQTLISRCPGCQTINIWQHNLLLNFTVTQFTSFMDFTSRLDTAEALFPFPDGEERFVLRTPHNDICFAFSVAEWEDFRVAMQEANYMLEVHTLLDHS